MEADMVMIDLQKGNARYVDGNGSRIGEHAKGQKPKAAILTCADSRVPPELIFDTWLGEIFTVRVAGNVAFEKSVIESLEYAVVHLSVPVVIVMGHTGCGAVKAAEEAGALGGLLGEVADSFTDRGDHVTENVLRQVKLLPKRSPAIARAMAAGGLLIKGAIYDLETGKVRYL